MAHIAQQGSSIFNASPDAAPLGRTGQATNVVNMTDTRSQHQQAMDAH